MSERMSTRGLIIPILIFNFFSPLEDRFIYVHSKCRP